MQQLKAKDSLPIYYWTGRESEVDFVLQDEDLVIPIEVKAGINLKAKSLGVYKEKYNPQKSIRTSLADFKVNDNLYDIPLYLIESMDILLKQS